MAAGRLSRARAAALALLLLALPLRGCIQDDGRRWNPIRSATEVSEDEERETGYAFDQQAREQLEFIDDPVVVGFLNDLGQSMVEQLEPQPFLYRFRVVNDPRLNAFAVPGGYVYFHSGTLLAAGSLDEVAGVMGHEIAHVKQRHYKRMVEKQAIPSLLTSLAGVAATAATGNPVPLMVAAGANVALQLHYSREFEAEADHYGAIYVSRAGYDVHGLERFFQRILEEKRKLPEGELPPYLYTHPDVEDRIAEVDALAEELRPMRKPDPDLERAFHAAQTRLAELVHSERSVLPAARLPADRALGDERIARANSLASEGDLAGAIYLLRTAEPQSPKDPRIPLRLGELYETQGRLDEAVAAYRRAVEDAPTTALVLFRLGQLYTRLGQRHQAVYYLEQAMRQSSPGSVLARRSQGAVERLTFPPVVDAGLSDRFGDAEPGRSRVAFEGGEVVWWARVRKRWLDHRDEIRVRWIDPQGHVRHEGPVELARKPLVEARLPRDAAAPTAGEWHVEALLGGDVIDRRSFRLGPGAGAEDPPS